MSRIREYSILLQHLKENREKTMPVSALLQFLPESENSDTIWQTHLRNLLEEWRRETNDRPRPVPLIEAYLYESLADQHRSRHLKNGIFLSTVHSVKGLEFDHVFVLGGSWHRQDGAEMEEERRLFYVAMTRARTTLQLMELDQSENPFTRDLEGDQVLRRRVDMPIDMRLPHKEYHIIGMKDLYLDYAGIFHQEHEIHGAIRRCSTGDKLKTVIRNEHIYLADDTDTIIARLSKVARDTWLPKIDTIREIYVLAMIRRGKEDISEEIYGDRCKFETWEVPVCEFVTCPT